MNTNTKTTVPAHTLTEGDTFRPNADRRYANTWYVLVYKRVCGATVALDYTCEGVSGVNTMTTARLATMEVK